MSKTGTPEKILSGLKSFLEPTGFTLKESDRSFLRKTDFGFQEVSLIGVSPSRGQFESGLPLYQGGVVLGIRFNKVERKLLPLELVVRKNNQKKTTTVSRAINGYYPFKRFRDRLFKISHKHADRDIVKVVGRAKKMLDTNGLDWFEKYSDLTTIEDEFNSAPFWKNTNLLKNPEIRIYKGVAVAGICKGKSHALMIAGHYMEGVRNNEKMPPISKNRIAEKTAKIIEQF